MEEKACVDSEVELSHSSSSSPGVIDWVSTGSHRDTATISYSRLAPSQKQRNTLFRLSCTINSSSYWMSRNFCLQAFADTLHPIVKPSYFPQTGKPTPSIWDELHIHTYILFVKTLLSVNVLDNVTASANAASLWIWSHASFHQKIALKKVALMQCQAWDLPSAKPGNLKVQFTLRTNACLLCSCHL